MFFADLVGGAVRGQRGGVGVKVIWLVKTGGRLVKHARYYWLKLTESHLTKRLFEGMVRRMETLPLPAG